MTDSPLQFTVSHKLLRKVIQSTGLGVMQVIDHSKIPDITYKRGDFKMFMSDVMISSDKNPEHNFQVEYTASRETDTLYLEVP